MANISAIKLPGGTTYNIKDNSGEKSVHNHELASIVPITSKTYTSSSYYATSSGSWEAASWYFMSVKPDTWDKPWKIRIRVHSFCPGYSNVESYTDALITGRRDGLAYSNYTERLDTAHYYIPYYTLKKAGFDAGLGHAIGISILYGTGYTTAAYYRTFKVDFYESENCTVTFFDTPIKWSSWTNGNTTNYNSLGSLDAVTRGYTQSGDRNDANYQNRIYYTYKKPYATLYRYQILLSRADGTLLPVNSVDNAPSNINKTLTIEEFDPFGEIYYYNSSTTRTTTQNLDNAVLYRQILADLRYSFNFTNESGKCLTGSQPVYIAATPQSNGMAKLASPALVQALPSTEDGKIYIYIGQAYPDTYPYRTELPLYHPIYWYKNGAICQYVGNPYTVNGHTVNSDVPANANFTDTKVNMIARGTTKSYLLGTTTAPTSSNQAVSSVAETGVYFDTTAGTLVATTFKGALTGTASGNLTSSSTLSAAKLSGAIPSAVTATTQASTDNSTKIATTAYVTTAIANLPEPMLFKGSVGTNGTTTWANLPTAASSNEGHTYKVITDHIAASDNPKAKVGDTIISNGSEWIVIPSGDEPSGTVTSVGISNGGGLSVSGSPITSSGTITVSHADTSSQASSSNSGRTYIQSITLDTYGHVTGLSTATETVTNTDTKLKVAEVTSATQYYPLVGTGTTAAERQYDTTGLKYKGTTGTTSAVGNATLELGNSTASGTAGNKQAQLIMYGTNAKKATITLAAPSADVALALPTSGGTLALTSQIPTVPSSTGSATTGISIAAHGTGTVIGVQSTTTTASKVTVGSHSTDYGVKSAGSASTWTFEEKTIPNVTSAGTASSWTFEEKTIPNVTAAGSGSASLTFAMDTTDTKKLKITFSHTHTAPTIGTAIKVQSKSGGSNGTAPTLGTAIKVQSKSGGANSTAPTLGSKVPTVSASDVTVPIKNTSASTFVTGTTHTITDNGHTHTI